MSIRRIGTYPWASQTHEAAVVDDYDMTGDDINNLSDYSQRTCRPSWDIKRLQMVDDGALG